MNTRLMGTNADRQLLNKFRNRRRYLAVTLPALRSQLESEVADIKNIGSGPYGGAIVWVYFSKFLEKGIPWATLYSWPCFCRCPMGNSPKRFRLVGNKLLLRFIKT